MIWDAIIVGGGLAGLSLARRLTATRPPGFTLLVIEAQREPGDRTYAFWTEDPTPWEGLLIGVWPHLRVRDAFEDRVLDLGRWRYCALSWSTLRGRALAELATHPGARVLDGTVTTIHDEPDGACVEVAGSSPDRTFRGRWVYDSRPPVLAAERGHVTFRGAFGGTWVETGADVFDPGVATLMDFRAPQAGGLGFYSVLPTSPRRALVMGVNMGPGGAPPSPSIAIERLLGSTPWQAVAQEGGVVPLADCPFVRRAGRHVLRIGIAGGRVRPTTGYAFVRIERDSAAIERALSSAGEPFALPGDPLAVRLLDTIMLIAMAVHGGRMARMFMRLFTHNPIDRVLRFLDDRPTVRDVFGLMGSLPPLWYLAAFGRWLLARIGFRGAIPLLAGASASSPSLEGEVPEGRRGRA